MKWVETQPFSLSTATAAIKLSERVSFDALSKFDGMTLTDLKAALEIIQQPPIKKRQQNTSTPEATSVQNAEAATSAQSVAQATDASSDTEASAERSDNADAAERHVTTTDYSKSNGRSKSDEVKVGVTLTASEVLGKALNLIVEAEKLGITPDCTDILAKLSEKITALSQPLQVVVAA